MEERQTQTEQNEIEQINTDVSSHSYYSETSGSKLQKVKGFVKKKKKQIAAISLIITIVGGGTGGFFFIGKTLEPLHIVANLQPFNFGVLENAEQNRTSRLIQRHFQRKAANAGEAEGNRKRTGNFISDGIENWRTDRMVDDLKAKGWEFEFADGKRWSGVRDISLATALVNEDGRRISFEGDNPRQFRKKMRPVTKDVYKPHQIGKRLTFRGNVSRYTGHTWRFFTGRKAVDGLRSAKNRLLGIDDSRSSQEVDVREEQRTADGDGTTEDVSTEETRQASSDINDNADEVRRQVAEGGDIDRVASARAARIVKGGVILAIPAVSCFAVSYSNNVDNINVKNSIQRARFAARMLTIKSQIEEGDDVSIGEIGEVVSLYHTEVEAEDGSVLRQDFNQSAAWKRATGKDLNGNEEDIGVSSDGSLGGFEKTFNVFGQAIDTIVSTASGGIVDAGSVCKVLGNGVVQFGFVAAEFLLSTASIVGTIVREIGEEVLVFGITNILKLLSYPDAINIESGLMALTTLDMGMNQLNSDHARAIGANEVSSERANELRSAYLNDLREQDRKRGFAWSYLDTNNPRSLLSSVSVQFATGANNIIDAAARIPGLALRSFGALINSKIGVRADDGLTNFNNYDLDQFAHDDELLVNINPIENENEMIHYLGYYCFELERSDGSTSERGKWRDEDGNMRTSQCDQDRFEKAKYLRTYINCTIVPEFILNEEYQGNNYANDCYNENDDPELKELRKKAGIFLFDRYLQENLDHAVTDISLRANVNQEMASVMVGLYQPPQTNSEGDFIDKGLDKDGCNQYDDLSGKIIYEDGEKVRDDSDRVDNAGCFREIFQYDDHINKADASTTINYQEGVGGEYSGLSAQELAQVLLDKGSPYTDSKQGQLQDIADGDNYIDRDILWVLTELSDKYEFRIASLKRDGNGGSRHNSGKAGDISGTTGINGVTFDWYGGSKDVVQEFINDGARLLLQLGDDRCGIGVPPNGEYIRATQEKFSNCIVFNDKGTGPHVHLDTRK